MDLELKELVDLYIEQKKKIVSSLYTQLNGEITDISEATHKTLLVSGKIQGLEEFFFTLKEFIQSKKQEV